MQQVWGGVLSFFIPFLITIFTMVPTVPLGDSGELITAACTLGVPHPPGFPVYCLLGKIFCTLPWGSPAWRVNLMSGFFGALTCLGLFLCLKRLKTATGVALAASLALATSQIFWSQSVVAEVYTLDSFFIAFLFTLGLRYRESSTPFVRNSFFFLLGLSLTNHWPLMVLTGPALLILLLAPLRHETAKSCGLAFVFFMAGLLPCLYLPWSSSRHPFIDWNHPHTFSNFLIHFLRQNTTENEVGWELANSFRLFFWGIGKLLGSDFTWLGTPLAVFGIVSFWSRQKELILSLLAGWLIPTMVIFWWVRIPWTGPFLKETIASFVPVSFFMAMMVGLGLQALWERTKKEEDLKEAPV